MNDYEYVFNSFIEYRKKINKSLPTLTQAKTKKIIKALEVVSKQDLILLFEYLSTSKDEYVKFINGENDNKRFYGSLDNLFRKSKLLEKVNRAKKWKQKEINIEKERGQDLYIPFMIVEKEDYEQMMEEVGDDYETDEKQENNIGTRNFQMSIFASRTKDK